MSDIVHGIAVDFSRDSLFDELGIKRLKESLILLPFFLLAVLSVAFLYHVSYLILMIVQKVLSILSPK
jgi:hypothetical protein